MKASRLILLAALSAAFLPSAAQQPLSYWFSTPTTLRGQAVWYGGHPERFDAQHKPVAAGNTAVNPDQEWESQSLPIGNGSIGANVMGSVEAERVTLNEKTLWRGGPATSDRPADYWDVNKASAGVIADIRQAFAEGDYGRAETLTKKNFNSTVPYEIEAEDPSRFGSFTTMGELYVETGLSTVGLTGYRRALSLDSAMASVSFRKDGTDYRRDFFVSYPANTLVMRFRASDAHGQHLVLSYAPNPVATGSVQPDGTDGLLYVARLDNNHMQFALRIRAISRTGRVSNDGGRLTVDASDDVVFLLTADTDYKQNFSPDFNDPKTYVGTDPLQTTAQWMDAAVGQGYDRLLAGHLADYSQLFSRVSLSLNTGTAAPDLPINERLARYRQGQEDFALESLYFQFGRYLLIASSRPGNLPANLQGIWHNNVDGPWRVDYHNNINLQMNYWPACVTGLAECELPLFDFIQGLVRPGEATAKSYFGARGWTASVSGNIFGFTSPLASEDMSWNFCPMAGPWLATHVWNYYDYTRDLQFLRQTGYPLIKSSAQFAYDYLWRRPDGVLTAAPSTSPEHGPVDEGATFVHAVIREILLDAVAASQTLDCDRAERRQWEDALEHLAPYRTGRYGQLMEWSRDIDDPDDHHRHVNHLFGLHPGHTISPITTPELAKASRVVLEHRGDGATGWSMGWKLNQWARLHDGNHAYTLFGNLLRNGTLDNLWDTHSPFQIDGNFGGTAGIAEMLLQSHAGCVHLLPALPDAWHEGSVRGLRARGRFTVDITWTDGRLVQAIILSEAGGKCTLRYGDATLTLKTRKGQRYKLTLEDGQLKATALK